MVRQKGLASTSPIGIFSRRMCFGAALLGQVALRGAILEARHARVVLAEVGRGVAQEKDVAARAQGCQHLGRRLRRGAGSEEQHQG
jgi:hypothetical protein